MRSRIRLSPCEPTPLAGHADPLNTGQPIERQTVKVKPSVIVLACALAASVGLNIGQYRQIKIERAQSGISFKALVQMHAINPAKGVTP